MTQDYINNNKERFLEELFEFIKIPSVSADMSFKNDVLKAASFLEQNLKDVGVDNVEVFPTEGHPIVYWTARGTTTGIDWTDVTRNQLDSWGVKYHDLKLGKPQYDLFIDDKALNTNDWR